MRAWGGKTYLQRFIDKVKQLIEIKELTPEIKRELYVERLLSKRRNGKVKIITGICRC